MGVFDLRPFSNFRVCFELKLFNLQKLRWRRQPIFKHSRLVELYDGSSFIPLDPPFFVTQSTAAVLMRRAQYQGTAALLTVLTPGTAEH